MAKTRFAGKGALVKCDFNGDTTFEDVGLCTNITPPGDSHARIDLTAMEDTAAYIEQGIAQASEFQFSQIWDPSDAGDQKVDTARSNGDELDWQIIITSGGSTVTLQFKAVVMDVVPQGFGGSDGVLRQVTLVRRGAVAVS